MAVKRRENETGWFEIGAFLVAAAGATLMYVAWLEARQHPALFNGLPILIFAIVAMSASGALLLWAQRTIPMGTAYAVWTGIGAVGAFTVGILAFGDSASAMRIVSIGLIVAGIIGLKLA